MHIFKQNKNDYILKIFNHINSFIKEKKNFQSPKGKILIVEESSVSIKDIEKSIKELGFAFERFEFVLDYDAVKRFCYQKVYNNPNYAIILASAQPHVSVDTNGYSITISYINRTCGYPWLIKLGTKNLKLTKSNLILVLKILLNIGFLIL